MDRKEYAENLKRIQDEHLKKVQENKDMNWQPCLHDQCPECHGTGIRMDGYNCIHYI